MLLGRLHCVVIQEFWSKTYFVVPINRKRVQSKFLEVDWILQFLTNTIIVYCGKIKVPDLSIVESQSEDIILHVNCICDFQDHAVILTDRS